MKGLAIFIILSCISFIAFSQQSVMLAFNTADASNTNSVFKRNLPGVIKDVKVVPPGFRMLKVGRPLTFFGGLIIVTGAFVNSIADKDGQYDPYTGTTTRDVKSVLGPVLIIAGAGMAIPGVVLWANGSKKYKNYLNSKKATTSIQFQGNGLSMKYRF